MSFDIEKTYQSVKQAWIQYTEHRDEYSPEGLGNLLEFMGERSGALIDEIERLRTYPEAMVGTGMHRLVTPCPACGHNVTVDVDGSDELPARVSADCRQCRITTTWEVKWEPLVYLGHILEMEAA